MKTKRRLKPLVIQGILGLGIIGVFVAAKGASIGSLSMALVGTVTALIAITVLTEN